MGARETTPPRERDRTRLVHVICKRKLWGLGVRINVLTRSPSLNCERGIWVKQLTVPVDDTGWLYLEWCREKRKLVVYGLWMKRFGGKEILFSFAIWYFN